MVGVEAQLHAFIITAVDGPQGSYPHFRERKFCDTWWKQFKFKFKFLLLFAERTALGQITRLTLINQGNVNRKANKKIIKHETQPHST